MNNLTRLFILTLTTLLSAPVAGKAETSGKFTILDQQISWIRTDDTFTIQGIKDAIKNKMRYPNGKETLFRPPEVHDLGGQLWESCDLLKQIQKDTESATRILGESKLQLDPIEIRVNDLTSWDQIQQIPLPVRAKLRKPMRKFLHDHYADIAQLVETSLNLDIPSEKFPKFLKCLTLRQEKIEIAQSSDVIRSMHHDIFEPCFGLHNPAISQMADNLPQTPKPLNKVYFSPHDPLRPDWQTHTLIIVHPSKEFHYPVSIQTPLKKWLKRFHQSDGPVAFLVHNDGFSEASYFVRPKKSDLVFYTETGKHPLCENCPEVTLAGGFIDWCLGLAARSYIANYFKDKNAGVIRLNFATDSIYTEAYQGFGTEGAITAIQEIKKYGIEKFIHRRIGSYLEHPEIKPVGSVLCQTDQEPTRECKEASERIVLSEIRGEDKDGRFYPFLRDNRFQFRIQVDGKEFTHPVGDLNSSKTIIFNVVTK